MFAPGAHDSAHLLAGTIDHPNWFARTPENTRYIYTGVAQQGLVLPACFPTFEEHAFRLDGSTNEPVVFGGRMSLGQVDYCKISDSGYK